jgi:hypothetical protein
LLSTFVVPATAAAATFALGKVLIEHFEMGGTLLTFDANAVRKHYYDEFTRSNATVAS